MTEKDEHAEPVKEAPETKEQAAQQKLSASVRIWQFLNSSFGIFVCSSIILASLSFGYRRWVEHQSDQRKIEQLDIEIGLRLKEMNGFAHLPERNRYNNIENIERVNEGRVQEERGGEVRDLFWIRRPAFPEYKDKNTTSLMWQLYLLVPPGERSSVRKAIQQSIQIDRLIPKIRFKAASEPEPPSAKTKKEQDKQVEEENNLKKDFGQNELFLLVSQLAEAPRWKVLALETEK